MLSGSMHAFNNGTAQGIRARTFPQYMVAPNHEAAEVLSGKTVLKHGALYLQITAPPCSFRQFPLSISNSTWTGIILDRY